MADSSLHIPVPIREESSEVLAECYRLSPGDAVGGFGVGEESLAGKKGQGVRFASPSKAGALSAGVSNSARLAPP